MDINQVLRTTVTLPNCYAKFSIAAAMAAMNTQHQCCIHECGGTLKPKNTLAYHQQNLPSVDQHASRIQNMYSMKSQQIGQGMAMPASFADSA